MGSDQTQGRKERFEQVLLSSREEDVQSFLAANPDILLNTFGDRWLVNQCIPKFRFGTQYVSDFVIVTGQSIHYEVTLAELEPPTERPFNVDGGFARRLNGAMAQIDDWLAWIGDNEDYFRSSLSRSLVDPLARQQIAMMQPRRPLVLKAKIVIGRRTMLSERGDRRRGTILEQHRGRLEILPYDRLLERVDLPPAGA